MREILFRGKRLDNGEWITGCLVKYAYNSTPYIGYLDAWGDGIYKVDPSTICQFTGLTDTYRNKIYEGDIVSGCDFDDVDGYGVVEWNDGAFEINNKNVSSTFHDNYWGYELEVIGNIHDNPELLEGEGN